MNNANFAAFFENGRLYYYNVFGASKHERSTMKYYTITVGSFCNIPGFYDDDYGIIGNEIIRVLNTNNGFMLYCWKMNHSLERMIHCIVYVPIKQQKPEEEMHPSKFLKNIEKVTLSESVWNYITIIICWKIQILLTQERATLVHFFVMFDLMHTILMAAWQLCLCSQCQE